MATPSRSAWTHLPRQPYVCCSLLLLQLGLQLGYDSLIRGPGIDHVLGSPTSFSRSMPPRHVPFSLFPALPNISDLWRRRLLVKAAGFLLRVGRCERAGFSYHGGLFVFVVLKGPPMHMGDTASWSTDPDVGLPWETVAR